MSFSDPAQQASYEQRREAVRLGREYIDQAGTPTRAAEAPPAQPQVPEALGGVKVGEAAQEPKIPGKVQEAAAETATPQPAPAALDRARDKARATLRDESAERAERIRAAGTLCGLQAPLGAQDPAQVATQAAKVVGPLSELDKNEFMRGVRAGAQTRHDLERRTGTEATKETPKPTQKPPRSEGRGGR